MPYLSKTYNINQLFRHNRSDILMRLHSYYKFAVVRHPLDRLVSGYTDKLAGGNEIFERILGSKILGTLRPNASKSEIKRGKGVTFQEYIKYLTYALGADQHFQNYQDHCHPCIIDYDYIVKLETHETDGKYIINEHLSGFGADSLVNKHSRRGGATLSKHLPEFETISSQLLGDITAVYSRDLDMFKYSIGQQNGHVIAVCGSEKAGECC